jgi:hypothetical protein
LAFGARRFPFSALAAMSAFSDFAPSFETPAASSDGPAFLLAEFLLRTTSIAARLA